MWAEPLREEFNEPQMKHGYEAKMRMGNAGGEWIER